MSEDSTPLQDAASSLHEMLLAYVEAGFSREEALRIVIAQVTNLPRPENS